MSNLLLIDIGETFGYTVGVIGQIRTFSSIMAVLFALVMAILSVRYESKSLLLIGLVFVIFSGLGCGLANGVEVLFLAYSLSGVGMAMVNPMTVTLIGKHYPLEKRSTAIGWLTAGASTAYLLGAPVIGFIENIGGWRLPFLIFLSPMVVLGLILVLRFIPSSDEAQIGRIDYFGGVKKIFSDKSATMCLFCVVLSTACWSGLLFYGISFYRQRFHVPINWASLIISGIALTFTVGGILSGKIVNRYGRKTSTIIGSLLLGVSTLSFTAIPVLYLSTVIAALGGFFAGIRYSASNSYTLEQVPSFRGTMMSMNSASMNLGYFLGSGIGGVALILYDWETFGLIIGCSGIIASIVYYLFTNDPTRAKDEMGLGEN